MTKEINARLGFLLDVGLDYLSLSASPPRSPAARLNASGLPARLARASSARLYVLDEPSIGLHQRDNRRLIDTLLRLRDLGNTVLVVEHDEETIREADWIVDIGPGAGEHGGDVVYSGPVKGSPRSRNRSPGSTWQARSTSRCRSSGASPAWNGSRSKGLASTTCATSMCASRSVASSPSPASAAAARARWSATSCCRF